MQSLLDLNIIDYQKECKSFFALNNIQSIIVLLYTAGAGAGMVIRYFCFSGGGYSE